MAADTTPADGMRSVCPEVSLPFLATEIFRLYHRNCFTLRS